MLVGSITLNVTATELATGHDADVPVGNVVTVAVAYGPFATEPEHEDGRVLPPDSPHEAGTVPPRRAIAVRNEASKNKSDPKYIQTDSSYDFMTKSNQWQIVVHRSSGNTAQQVPLRWECTSQSDPYTHQHMP